MSGIRSRKGSTTVFICIIMSSMIVLVMMFIGLSARTAASSYGSAVLNLAGRSILSEFDERLKEQYGIVAFYGLSADIQDKITDYASYSLDNNRYMEISDVEADLKEYSLLNVDVFREQVTEDGISSKDFKRDKGKVHVSGRELRSSAIIKMLPSYGIELDTPGIKSLKNAIEEHPDGEGIVRKGTKAYLTNNYIMEYFNSGAFRVTDNDTFFRGEVEYILEGEYGDELNLKRIREDIIELRTILNSAYLWESEVKKAEALAAAELLTPGPEAVATQAVIIESWALAEAEMDADILFSGGRIPLLKTRENWNTDIGSVLESAESKAEGEKEGLTYDEYLKVLLCSLDDRTKYLRMMDLIQINLEGTYSECFTMRDMYTGFSFTAEINGREFTYEEVY